MAKKKSFSIGSSLSQALTDTVSAAKNYSGELHVEVIPLRKIELDPDNPRDLALTYSDLFNGFAPDEKQKERKLRETESLRSMKNSIIEQGIINPILVYKLGEQYRLIAGERRTLASILAGKEDIPAKILTVKPNPLKLSLLQWIENIEREDLSLWERMRNLEKILAAHAAEQQRSPDQISPTELSQLIACSIQQAINYKNVLGASQKLRQLIQDNQIKNIEKAALISKADLAIQDELITACLQGATLAELKNKAATSHTAPVEKQTAPETRGRQATRVTFGTTHNLDVAKVIIQSVLCNAHYSHLNKQLGAICWDDYKSINQAFKTLINLLEKTNG